MLLECLNHLKDQTYRSFDVLIVDNCSTDGTEDVLFSYRIDGHSINYIKLDSNIGGAGGFNYGLRYSVEHNYKYCWIMDDDCFPTATALQELMQADEKLGYKNYGYLSSVVLWTDGSECKMNRQKISRKFYEKIEQLEHGIVKIDQATFVSLLFPSWVIQKYGLPIKEYFIWGDDIEYTRRIAVRGNVNSYLVGKSKAVHAMPNNEGSSIAFDSYDRLDRYNFAFRNDNYTYRQEGLKGFLYYIGKCGINGLRVICQARDHKFKRCGIILKQFWAGLVFNPKVEYT